MASLRLWLLSAVFAACAIALWSNDTRITIDPTDPVIASQANTAVFSDQKGSLYFHFSNSSPEKSDNRAFRLPIESLCNSRVIVRAQVKANLTSRPPQAWNGVKLMLKIESPDGIVWPQVNFPSLTFDWGEFSAQFQIPDTAQKVTLILGLERVAGDVSMRDISLEIRPQAAMPSPAAANAAIFTGHSEPHLRGAMVSPKTIQRQDFDLLTKDWGANVVRWQLIRPNGGSDDFAAYDAWLDEMLDKLDQALIWAAENKTRVVVDLHSPPGGQDSAGGYKSATNQPFASVLAENHFIEIWQKISQRYKGNKVIWGFDILNEPIDTGTATDGLDWNQLALKTAQAIREIDSQRTLIIESINAEPANFRYLRPLPMAGIVYSLHMYAPGEFTHQGVYFPRGAAYPGIINGKSWAKSALEANLKPAVDFAQRYRVQIYVGEFSAIRWAQGADRYLLDLIAIFNEKGWDWTYHAFREWDGWSVEHDSEPGNHQPAKAETIRLKILKQGFVEK